MNICTYIPKWMMAVVPVVLLLAGCSSSGRQATDPPAEQLRSPAELVQALQENRQEIEKTVHLVETTSDPQGIRRKRLRQQLEQGLARADQLLELASAEDSQRESGYCTKVHILAVGVRFGVFDLADLDSLLAKLRDAEPGSAAIALAESKRLELQASIDKRAGVLKAQATRPVKMGERKHAHLAEVLKKLGGRRSGYFVIWAEQNSYVDGQVTHGVEETCKYVGQLRPGWTWEVAESYPDSRQGRDAAMNHLRKLMSNTITIPVFE